MCDFKGPGMAFLPRCALTFRLWLSPHLHHLEAVLRSGQGLCSRISYGITGKASFSLPVK